MARTITVPQPPQLDAPLDMETLGAFVRYKRSTLGITLEDAAALCGLSKQAYNNIEKGVVTVRAETLFKALNGLGIALTVAPQQETDDEWI